MKVLKPSINREMHTALIQKLCLQTNPAGLLSCCNVSTMHHTTSTDMVTKTLLRPVTADQSEQAELLRREA